MDITKSLILNEGKVYCEYLTGKQIKENILILYTNGLETHHCYPNNIEIPLITFIFKYPFFLSSIDNAFRLFKMNNNLGKRIYLMSCILESFPEYSEIYLQKKHTLLYLFILPFICIKSIFQAIIGKLILRILLHER